MAPFQIWSGMVEPGQEEELPSSVPSTKLQDNQLLYQFQLFIELARMRNFGKDAEQIGWAITHLTFSVRYHKIGF